MTFASRVAAKWKIRTLKAYTHKLEHTSLNAPGLSSGPNHPPLTGSVSRTHHARMDSPNHGKAEAGVLKWDCFSSILDEIWIEPALVDVLTEWKKRSDLDYEH